MADKELPAHYLTAGEEYLAALRRLGLRPDALLWAIDKTIDDYALVLITSHFDYAGPLEIYRLLTKAYNLSATPKEISPFIVRLHSPKQAIGKAVLGLHGDIRDADGKRSQMLVLDFANHDLEYQNGWIYVIGTPRKHSISMAARRVQWDKFKASIEQLAA